ncbi:glycosyltransferase [Microcoleus sp. FACHB-672]|uniref:glycosyltransferase n=1 Tax=Microcoleus sp. FACHB-672 TaxID=2692825 RepID=UPI0016843A28|nr:glycosyltransferase [Microcoleus sp. FACHB-672]MBD2043011.1 glycosyltransferase [Microcoleus sp. FACHB-672]
MRLIHTLSWYFPDTSGGCEVYVDGLVQGLCAYGITGTVAASRHGTQEAVYRHNGVEVYRYPLYPQPTKAQQRQQLLPSGFEYFSRWLEAHPADIYHQHSWRFGCGLHHLRLARQLGMPAIVTVHLPEAVCLRGTMMLHGQTACDGWIDPARCGHCIGVPERVSPALARALSYVPLRVGTATESELLNSDSIRLRQLARAVGIPPWVRRHRHLLLEMANLADRIVAVCQWLYDALLINGVPEEKLVLCRQGVGDAGSRTIARRNRHPDDPLRIGFLGRWQDTKGAQVLAGAIERLPAHIPVELVIHGMVHGEADKVNRDLVLAIAQKDPRIQVAEKLSREEVPAAVAGFDLLAVPSQGFETGPLVVLEAHAVGTPVIGSDVGGVNELVHHGVDGWLVPAADVNAWSEAIAQLATDVGLLPKLRQGIKPVRTMEDAVADMAKVYEDVIGHGA